MFDKFGRLLVAFAVLGSVVAVTPAIAQTPSPDAFSPDSFWNIPAASDADIHPNSDGIIDFLMADNDLNGCITLAGAGSGNKWGMPVFTADSSDTVYNVTSVKWAIPPEFGSLRIPAGAEAADTSDGEMVVYDTVKGVVAQLSKATYDSRKDAWTVSGGSVAYLDSNGLDGSLPQSDDPRNDGSFRGYPGSVAMVHYDDIANGKLDNVVKIGVNTANSGHTFPMIGSDGDTSNPDAPVQGTRIRIRSDVNLAALGLSGHALTIAKGLQEYGMVVGDSTGGAVVLKLEDTVNSGRGDVWDLNRQSLCAITGDHLEVIVDAGTYTPPTDPPPSDPPPSDPPPSDPPPTSPPGSFSDTAGHVFEADIEWLVDQGITSGCGNGRFCPDAVVTRGQMAAFLGRALDLPNGPSADFADTDGHVFEADVDRLYHAGITKGCSADNFCPNGPVNRGQMAAFLVRAFGLPATTASPFTDTADSIFAGDIDRLAASGITRGCAADRYCPNASVTRGQMAAFLRRALQR